MISHIIFDLDGVLVNTKDLHYIALNRALEKLGYPVITHHDHMTKYDGKPTIQKLQIMGIHQSAYKTINSLKQDFTCELLEQCIEKNEIVINIFRTLKNRDFYVCVASNSVRYTIEVCLYRLGVLKYVDYIISNQDVKQGKPDPEMYLKCMLHVGVGPKNTMIVEDSYVGRSAVANSGSNLCAVNSPLDLTIEHIDKWINKYNDVNVKWKGNNMNVLIPMAGVGSRFIKAGYTFPKPLIEVHGKPMIQVVVENLNIEATYIYVVRKEHFETYNLSHLLPLITPECKIVVVDKVTEGAACTTLLAKEYINTENPLLIANSDQFVEWDSSHFLYTMQSPYFHGGIPCFESTHPKWSYAKTDDNGIVTEIQEKVPISKNATVGIYYWSKGQDYVKYAEQMINKNIRVNGEFYVAPVFNEAIADGLHFKVYNIEKMWGLGTPEDLSYFLSNYKGDMCWSDPV